MPSYSYDGFQYVYIESNSKPLPGQRYRSSNNYHLDDLPSSKNHHWVWSCPNGIRFDVMEDRAYESDPVVYSNIGNLYVTVCPPESTCKSLYIANPTYNGKPIPYDFTFEIKIALYENWEG